MELEKIYLEKNEYLNQYYEEVPPLDFYRDVFPVGSFQKMGEYSERKPNGIALEIKGNNDAAHFILFDDLDGLDEIIDKDFVICSAISYIGRSRAGINSRFFFAFIFDLDAVEIPQLRDLFFQIENGFLPMPTYVVNSGGGVHLYYVLNTPVPLFPDNQRHLKELKVALTNRIWNPYTSKRKDTEIQGIFQGFRMVGSPTKLGRDFRVKAFSCGKKFDLEELVSYIPEEEQKKFKFTAAARKKSKMSLEEAKKLYPDWYERRVVNGEKKGRWHVKRDLYDWWKRKIKIEIKVGHRYFALMSLAIYAKKCDIEYDELRKDAFEIMSIFDRLTNDSKNHFTRDDVIAALEAYNENYITFPRDDIEKLTNVSIPANKRNGRKQEVHLKIARATQDILYPNGEWRYRPPTKENEIRQYLIANPTATKGDIKNDLNISYSTIRKYYDTIKEEISRG